MPHTQRYLLGCAVIPKKHHPKYRSYGVSTTIPRTRGKPFYRVAKVLGLRVAVELNEVECGVFVSVDRPG